MALFIAIAKIRLFVLSRKKLQKLRRDGTAERKLAIADGHGVNSAAV